MPATSKAQQAVFGIARSIQKGKRPAGSGPAAQIARDAKPKDVEDFASTPTKGLPQRVTKEDIGRIREYVTKVVREIVMKRRTANEDGQGLMKSEAGRDDPAHRHQLRIARDTLKMSRVGANIMGGMTPDEAREILKKHIGEDAKQLKESVTELRWVDGNLEKFYSRVTGSEAQVKKEIERIEAKLKSQGRRSSVGAISRRKIDPKKKDGPWTKVTGRQLSEAKFEFEWYEQGRWLTKTITGTEHDANVMLDKLRDRVHTAGEATGNVSYTKVG